MAGSSSDNDYLIITSTDGKIKFCKIQLFRVEGDLE